MQQKGLLFIHIMIILSIYKRLFKPDITPQSHTKIIKNIEPSLNL